MGFFDELEKVAGAVTSGTAAPGQPAAAGANPALMQEAMGLLTNNNSGGLAGLTQQFEQAGLGHLMSSWVGPGANLPVTGQQLQSVLGNQKLQELAQRVGLPPEAAASALATVLPSLVDRMTPNGTLEHQLLTDGVSWLEGRLTT